MEVVLDVPTDSKILVESALHAPRGVQNVLVVQAAVTLATLGTTYLTRSTSSVQLIAMRAAMLSPAFPTG